MRRSLGQACLILAVAGNLAAAVPSWGQSAFPDPSGTQAVPGSVQMCLNAKGQAVPCAFSDLLPQPDVTLANTGATADRKALIVTPSPNAFALKPVVSGTAESSHVLLSGPGKLWGAYISNPSASGYLMVFDALTAPGDGAVTPKHCLPVSASNVAFVNFMSGPPEFYATGIVAVLSSTGCFTKTTSPTGFFHGSVQ